MVTTDKILRVCDVCHLVELEENILVLKNDPTIRTLIDNGYELSHCTLSRQCAKDFHKEDFPDIADIYLPGLYEGKRTYEACKLSD
jgi:hypothetical protein